MIITIIGITAFFSPSVRLENGRNVKVIGKGPPVVFCPGLYGTMPTNLYNSLINGIKKDLSVIVFDDLSPVYKSDLEYAADAIGANKVGFLSHSAIDLDILNSDRIEHALLHDPITSPQFSFMGLETSEIDTDLKVTIVNAENTVNGNIPLPNFNIPKINGNCDYIVDLNVGHADILDPMWSGFARKFPLWNSGLKKYSLMDYGDWVFSSRKNDDTEDYRRFVIDRIKNIFSKKVNNEKKTLEIVYEKEVKKENPVFKKENKDTKNYENEYPSDYD